MIVIKGKSVFGGIAIGRISYLKKSREIVKRTIISDTRKELARFEAARQAAILQLEELYEQAAAKVGEANAMIIQIHQMMLEDLDYLEAVNNMIENQGVTAEYATSVTGDSFSLKFSSMEDEYMRERAADVLDISERVIKILRKEKQTAPSPKGPVIIASDDLAPSETIQLDKEMVLSFLTKYGSLNSHTAILARTMNIPAVIGLQDGLTEDWDGKTAVVDGFTGTVYLDPDEKTLEEMEEKKRREEEKKELLFSLKGKENITKDGKAIQLYANIGNSSDIGAVLENDAGGIGLFRSEFLYLEKSDYPTEEEQFSVYKYVAESLAGKKVIIRTLDIGADKQVPYFDLPKEENPALGYRAIRICLTRKELFKTQLRALYRASAFGNISIMFPMITSLKEVLEIKEVAAEVKAELKKAGIPYKENLELGIMLETPAAVLISDLLAQEVDFFSVGTNDLTQYTTAVDRQNPMLDKFYDPHHLSILRMLKLAADNAHKNGKWIGICGELAGDLSLTEAFLSIGIDELSVSPALILPLRQKVRESSVGPVNPDWFL
ncbi:phosphoenolpyruvate--protein phosphotransferase [Anaerocolumna jejuensis DSM 15929]|uniref:Phosphoenolpyruvate-protein phosphotransferase n=1 Tax=Anaerocolumna jejuensis DSM 15929 TaxID=1121322 RepID=A0A1M6QSB3_9FIRM|nr:phosphoenolpyruvate--protein phosphotransferase [Anaerocolumna jejuensis]SHK22907.1 phosphoenolpyruvate--protein phosphotransferase [Anaerocolumna jejuensis DSM 15929]